MHTTERVDVDDVTLAVTVEGVGDPALVLVHGYTGSSRDWDGVAADLAADRRVVRYDHRGHGESTHTGDATTYTIDQLVADLSHLVDRLEIDRFHLLGHSLGGVVAMQFVLDRPERVRSLIAMDTSPFPASGALADLVDPIAEQGRTQGMAAVYETIRPFVTGVPPGLPPRTPAEDAEADARLRWAFEHLDPDAFAALGHQLACYDSLVDRLPQIGCPTTVIVGEHDVALRPGADALAAGIPGARLVVVSGAAHSPQLEHRGAWLAAVGAHLDAA